ncbi:hypothetical protein FRC01_004229, partial [Tulasnella sp. 417]
LTHERDDYISQRYSFPFCFATTTSFLLKNLPRHPTHLLGASKSFLREIFASMQSHTPQRARSARLQGTRGHQSSAALPSLAPPTPQPSTPSSTYWSQSPAGSIHVSSQTSQAEASDYLQHESGVLTEENDEQNAEPGPSAQSPGSIRQERFPNQLYKMIEDKQMEPYIKWDGPDVFSIPDIPKFEEHALRVYFRRMQDGSAQYKFSHQNKKFYRGQYELLREVVPKSKHHTTFTPQVVVQAQPPTLSTPSFPGSPTPHSSQAYPDARLYRLENLVLELKEELARQAARENQLLAKEKWLLTREKRLLGREARVLAKEKRLAEKKKRLRAKEKRLLARESRPPEEFQPVELSEEEPAIIPEDDSPRPMDQTGSAGAALDEDSQMYNAGDSLDVGDGIPTGPQIGGRDVQEEGSSNLAMGTALDITQLPPSVKQPTPLEPPGSPSPTGTRPSSPSLYGGSTIQDLLPSWFNVPFLGAWCQDPPTTTLGSQAPAFVQTSIAPGPKMTVAHLPPPSPPWPDRCL